MPAWLLLLIKISLYHPLNSYCSSFIFFLFSPGKSLFLARQHIWVHMCLLFLYCSPFVSSHHFFFCYLKQSIFLNYNWSLVRGGGGGVFAPKTLPIFGLPCWVERGGGVGWYWIQLWYLQGILKMGGENQKKNCLLLYPCTGGEWRRRGFSSWFLWGGEGVLFFSFSFSSCGFWSHLVSSCS